MKPKTVPPGAATDDEKAFSEALGLVHTKLDELAALTSTFDSTLKAMRQCIADVANAQQRLNDRQTRTERRQTDLIKRVEKVEIGLEALQTEVAALRSSTILPPAPVTAGG